MATMERSATEIGKKFQLPALSQNTFLRYFSFVVLYVAQGVPEGMTYFGIPAWLAMNGRSPAEIGSYVAAIGIPWSFKIVVAPLMDRFTFLSMGRRRPWVLFGQLGLMVSFILLSQVHDPLNHINSLMIAGFFVSFFGATQDVATDGMAIDVIPIKEQARANGLMWGSKTIGISLSLVTGNWIINHYGFSTAILSLSLCVCLIMVVPLLMRERPGEKLLPWTKGKATATAVKLQADSFRTIFKSLFQVTSLRSSFFMITGVFFIQLAFGLIETLLPVFTIQGAGWTDSGYSRIYSLANIIAGILGMIAGGAIADHFGKVRMMNVYLISLILLLTVMSFIKAWWHIGFIITLFIILYLILYVFLTVAIFATCMQLCWKRVAATQFTLYMTFSNLGRASGAALLGPLRSALNWEFVILINVVFALTMLLLIQMLRLKKHLGKIEILEEKHASNSSQEPLLSTA